jgi:cell division protein ZipA
MELRWVLLGLGALVVLGVYLWSKGIFRRAAVAKLLPARTEPTFGDTSSDDTPSVTPPPSPPPEKRKPRQPDRIVALRLVPRHEELSSEKAVQALQGAGLEHGRYGIFHRLNEYSGEEPLFSVASLTEPGSFDLGNLADKTIPGLSFFIVLPGAGDPVARFDMMIETARGLTVELDAELRDERGSSWSVQRERYVREEIIEYRHQLERR